MNIILVLVDSLNKEALRTYTPNTICESPNLEFRSPAHMRQYYANVIHRKGEEDFFPALTFTAAGKWLEENASNGPFFLQVESFDVHEPFHVPEPYFYHRSRP